MSDAEYKVADREELPEEGSRLLVDVDGREIAVFRSGGEFFALANFCPHQSGPLYEGELVGKMEIDDERGTWEYAETNRVVACPWHGWTFDIETGENTQTSRYRVPTYEVDEREDGLYLELY
jgi:nitrite reductase/ring-hydroxylating ferredoxin subunit